MTTVIALRTVIKGRVHWHVDTIHPTKVEEAYIAARRFFPEHQPELVFVDVRVMGSPDEV